MNAKTTQLVLHTMPNIASVFKGEVARIARKELRAEFDAIRKVVSQHRTEIAALKRQVKALQQQIKHVEKATTGTVSAGQESEDQMKIRFSAKGLATQRKRLGLSAAAVAQILGVSALSVYKWESGKTRPRAAQLEAISSLRKLGKREAAAKLAAS